MPNSTINATVNGLNSTAGNVATLDLQVAGSTVASATASGVSVTGTLSASGATTLSGAVSASSLSVNSNNISADNSLGFRNRIINGGFSIAQRGTSFVSGANDDDTYNLDRWYILSDGNDAVDITQTTTVPTGAKYSIGLDVETVNKKFGIAQIIENINCFDAIGQTVTLSFNAKVSSTTKLDNVKCAVVAWSGTADSVTSDIISAWNVEGTNPTLITNATYENTPANLNVTTSWARYSVSATIDTASTNNVIVFIWSDVTDTTLGDFLYITNVQLEVGSVATPFERRPFTTEVQLCQRYYTKTYNLDVKPATVTAEGSLSFVNTSTTVSYQPFLTWAFPVQMRDKPTLTFYSQSDGAVGQLWRGSNFNATTNTAVNGTRQVSVYPDGQLTTTGDGYFQIVASIEL